MMMVSAVRNMAIGGAALGLCAGLGFPAQAAYTVTLLQQGPDVVATGSGSGTTRRTAGCARSWSRNWAALPRANAATPQPLVAGRAFRAFSRSAITFCIIGCRSCSRAGTAPRFAAHIRVVRYRVVAEANRICKGGEPVRKAELVPRHFRIAVCVSKFGMHARVRPNAIREQSGVQLQRLRDYVVDTASSVINGCYGIVTLAFVRHPEVRDDFAAHITLRLGRTCPAARH